ncbi:hypothetical protein [Vulcaniibacterium tengchongense]|uniref:Uncharacterized protein n=1 Tax=Vulcaniibacterium tengchongense TaxID=1273429 RepID=A0A3N4W412_9GAMM|nr:hypothetical protein [Vulcaniibacterium tengchongense]RPE79954.1 hypothetical protein EDC50_1784 [Vulcaniibacterium tengchongense]
MNTRDDDIPRDLVRPPEPGGEISGQHHGLRRPGDEQRLDQALREADLEDRGESVEDRLRDRRSSGVPAEDGGEDAAAE